MGMGFLDIIFPKKCIGCGKEGSYVCDKCEVGMWEEEQICPSCRRNSRYGLRHEKCRGYLQGLTCLWAYEGVARKLIKDMKYRGYFDYLEGLWEKSKELWERPEFACFDKFLETKPVVVPIPLFSSRYKTRGFNQAEKIARLVARSWTCLPAGRLLDVRDLLIRIKDTGQQVGKTREERLRAMDNAFALKSIIKGPGSVLLVDDVWTTGATMMECARVLKKAGVEKIWGFVLAR